MANGTKSVVNLLMDLRQNVALSSPNYKKTYGAVRMSKKQSVAFKAQKTEQKLVIFQMPGEDKYEGRRVERMGSVMKKSR
jgi:hypothetical protein